MDFISEYRVLDLHERQDPPGIRGVCALQIWSVMGGWVFFFSIRIMLHQCCLTALQSITLHGWVIWMGWLG
jgi:hypothetical protein